jgi:PAS domain S-box-containing protein
MNNPLPVDPFSVAEAARRTWPVLIEAMLEAVCLVEPEGLRIVAANGAAGRLLGLHPSELVGRDMLATAPTPEDETFWQRVADDGGCANILSDSYITHARGQAVPVVRRVSRIEPAPGNALYVVALVDRSEQMRVERAAAISTAELAATLESSLSSTWPATSATSTGASRRCGSFPTRCCCCAPTTKSSTGCASTSPIPASTCGAWPRSTPRRCCARPTR